MEKDLQEILFNRYPELYRPREGDPLAMFGLQIPDGWFDLADQLSADIMAYVERTGIPTPVVFQMKEKFGMLLVYLDESNDDLEQMIVQAVGRSKNLCEECGAEGILYERNRSWLHVFCEKHAEGVPVTKVVTATIPVGSYPTDDWL
jgi:hypothetical protein